MKDLRDIAEDEDLTYIETTDSKNGYPSHLVGAVIGFDSFTQAKELALKEGLQVYTFEKRDGWQLWTRKFPAYEPFTVGSSNYGDDYSELGKMREYDFYIQEVRDLLPECQTMDEAKELIKNKEEIFDKIESAGFDELVIVYDGKYYDTIKKECMSYSIDTHNHAIGVIRL